MLAVCLFLAVIIIVILAVLLYAACGSWAEQERELDTYRRENTRLVAAIDLARAERDRAASERDAALADRDEWAKQAGKDRGLAEAARRELETARMDDAERARASGQAIADASRGRIEALTRIKDSETKLHEAREFLET